MNNPFRGRPLRTALFATLSLRLFTSLAAALIAWLVPVWITPGAPHDPQLLAALENGPVLTRLFLAPWYRWDTIHYLEIAQQGYADPNNTIWPPLYPLLIRTAMLTGLPALISALLISTLSTFGALLLLYRLAEKDWAEEQATFAVLALIFFPTAFFLMAGYSEATFLLCSLACICAMRQRRWLLAGLLGAAAVLTRHQGIFLTLPLAWEGLRHLQLLPNRQRLSAAMPWLGGLSLPPIAMLSYGLYIRVFTQADWPWKTVSSGWNQHLGWPWEGILGNLRALLAGAPIGGGALFFNLSLALLSLILLLVGIRRLPVSYSLFGWTLLLSVLVKVQNEGLLGATARYALIIFPIFFVLAFALKNRLMRICYITIAAGAQILLLAAFYWWAWVP
jgi:hypothetical protein